MPSPLSIFGEKRHSGRKLAMISLYDAPTARLCCKAGVDALLVGDSLGNVILGYPNTLSVTVDDMERHGAAVVRGVQQAGSAVPVIIDMPFGSYHGGREATVSNAVRLMRTQAQGLKLEGASASILEAIELLVEVGIPVMGHLGFTPQSSLQKVNIVQGRTAAAAETLLRDARRLQEAGCFAVVLEAVAHQVATLVTQELTICTVGIGAGTGCDGQVLVWHDLAGLSDEPPFKFARLFGAVQTAMADAAGAYVSEVHDGNFPDETHAWAMPEAEWKQWRGAGDNHTL